MSRASVLVTSAASEITVFRTDDRPLRFEGWLLGGATVSDDTGNYTRVRLFRTSGGNYVWAWDKSFLQEPKNENLDRADASVFAARQIYDSGKMRDMTRAELVEEVWMNRPSKNARVTEAAVRAWHAAAAQDSEIASALYEDVA